MQKVSFRDDSTFRHAALHVPPCHRWEENFTREERRERRREEPVADQAPEITISHELSFGRVIVIVLLSEIIFHLFTSLS